MRFACANTHDDFRRLLFAFLNRFFFINSLIGCEKERIKKEAKEKVPTIY